MPPESPLASVIVLTALLTVPGALPWPAGAAETDPPGELDSIVARGFAPPSIGTWWTMFPTLEGPYVARRDPHGQSPELVSFGKSGMAAPGGGLPGRAPALKARLATATVLDVSRDGRLVALIDGIEAARKALVWDLAADKPVFARELPDGSTLGRMAFSGDGGALFAWWTLPSGERQAMHASVGTGEAEVHATGVDEQIDCDELVVLKDGSHACFLDGSYKRFDRKGGLRARASLKAEGRALKAYENARTGRIRLVTSKGDLHELDAATGKTFARRRIPGGTPVWGAGFSPDGEGLVVVTGDHLQPKAAVVDLKTGKATSLPLPNPLFLASTLGFPVFYGNREVGLVSTSSLRSYGLDGVNLDIRSHTLGRMAGELAKARDRDGLLKLARVLQRDDVRLKPEPQARAAGLALQLLETRSLGRPETNTLLREFHAELPAARLRALSLKTQDPELRTILADLASSKSAPWLLKLDALRIPSPGPWYTRRLVDALRTPEARTARGARVPPETLPEAVAVETVRVLAGGYSDAADADRIGWALAEGKVKPTTELLEALFPDPKAARAEVDQLIQSESDPLKYRLLPDLGVLKFARAIVATEPPDCDGNPATGAPPSEPARPALAWLAAYGDLPGADRVLVAKVARYVFENRKPMCPQDRNLLLTAMLGWTRATGNQMELACAVGASFSGLEPAARTFEDSMLIARTVGVQSELSESEWIEQLRAYGTPGAALDEEMETGLLQFALGRPAGVWKVRGLKAEYLKSGKGGVDMPALKPKKGSIARLCGIAARGDVENGASIAQGAKRWLARLKRQLDGPLPLVAGFEPSSGGDAGTLRQAFVAAGMEADLAAVENGCEGAPAADSGARVKPARSKAASKKRAQTPPPPPTKDGVIYDFNPNGRKRR